MKYYLALLLGSQLDMGTLYLAFIFYVVVQMIVFEDFSFSKIQWQYLGIFVFGMMISLIYMYLNDDAYKDMSSMLLNIRKNFIEIAFSIALYEFLKYKNLEYVLSVIFISVLFNIAMGTYQLITTFPERIDMLFPEPSAAGYYYLFVFFILFEKFKENKYMFYASRYFMVIGLAIGSKAQIALLALVTLLRYSTPAKLLLLSGLLGSILYLFWSDISNITAIKYNLNVLNIYWEDGLAGLRTDNGVWGTYVTRISAIEGALRCLIENPFGIGFGGFHSWFLENMSHINFKSTETDEILAGLSYATPKSNLLSFFVVTGIVGISLYATWLKEFYIAGKQHAYLFQSFIILTFASLFIELNPMFVYIMVLFILKEKEANLDREEEHEK
jgi:hypothetical protein